MDSTISPADDSPKPGPSVHAGMVRVDRLDPHPDNPRKSFDAQKLAELEASVRQTGVIEPLIVRTHPKKPGRSQIICGERRWRAAKAAGVETVPCVFRDDLDDSAILEFMLIENTQRADVDELEEAESFQKLLDLNSAYDTARIALKVGMSVRHVQARLELLRLIPPAKEALRAHRITAAHGQLLCRLTPENQELAFDACFQDVKLHAVTPRQEELLEMAQEALDDPDSAFAKQAVKDLKKAGVDDPRDAVPTRLVSVRELDDWIKRHLRADRKLLQEELPELAAAVESADVEGRKVIEISYLQKRALPQSYELPHDETKRAELLAARKRVVFAGDWKRADGTKKTTKEPYDDKLYDSPKCDAAVLGVVTFGPQIGEQLQVCVDKKGCKVHWGDYQKQAKERQRLYGQSNSVSREDQEARWKAEREKGERERKRHGVFAAAAIAAIVAAAPKHQKHATALLSRLLSDRYGYHDGGALKKIAQTFKVDVKPLIAKAEAAVPEPAKEKPAKAAAKKPAKKGTKGGRKKR